MPNYMEDFSMILPLERNKNLVACLADTDFPGWRIFNEERLLRSLLSLQLTIRKGDWIIVEPVESLPSVRSKRTDRLALQRAARAIQSGVLPSIDQQLFRNDWLEAVSGRHDLANIVPCTLTFYEPGMHMLSGIHFDVDRSWADFSSNVKQLIRDSGTLPWNQLSRNEKDAVLASMMNSVSSSEINKWRAQYSQSSSSLESLSLRRFIQQYQSELEVHAYRRVVADSVIAFSPIGTRVIGCYSKDFWDEYAGIKSEPLGWRRVVGYSLVLRGGREGWGTSAVFIEGEFSTQRVPD